MTTTPARTTFDGTTLQRLEATLGKILATHESELLASTGPEADTHRAACAAVRAALDRIADGTYGRCTGCGDPLLLERLEIIPQAELCMACLERPGRLYG